MRDAPAEQLPFLQRDIVQLHERKAILRPQTAAPAENIGTAAGPSNLTLRAARPRSAGQRADPDAPHARPVGNIIGGFAFPIGSMSPRPEVMRAKSSPRQRQPLSAVEASRRKALGLADPDDQAIEPSAILPAVSGLNLSKAEPGWFERATTGPATGIQNADYGAGAPLAVPAPRQASALTDATNGSLPRPLQSDHENGDAVAGRDDCDPGGRSTSPITLASPRTRGVIDFPSVEVLNEAVDERTAVLTRLFQERLARQMASLQGIRDAETRQHEKEIKALKQTFEDRLSEAVEKVRAVHATNRDAGAILAKNKKLRTEVAQLKHALMSAQNAQRDAEARERQRREDGEAVVQQLMQQLQEKEALLAAGAGAMSEEEREEMLERERQRAQAAMDREKKRIETATHEEMQKLQAKLQNAEDELTSTKDKLEEAGRTAKSASSQLEREKHAHQQTAERLAALEKLREEEAWKLERLQELDVKVTAAMKQVHHALDNIRDFLEQTEEHHKVDLSCHCCFNPLLEPQVLVPCGHSICRTCCQALDAQVTEHDPNKYCPVCKANAAKASAEDSGGDLEAVQGFPNTMLDLCLHRLRTKEQTLEAFLNLVGGIFAEVAPSKPPLQPSVPQEPDAVP